MRGFYTFVLSLLIFGTSVLLSDSAAAKNDVETNIRERIEVLEKKIENTRKELERDKKKLESQKKEKKKVLDEISYTDKKINTVNRNLWAIRKEENFLKNSISDARKQHRDAGRRIRDHSEVYAARLKSMYKRHNVSALEVMFSTGSFSSFLWGFRMLAVLAVEDMKVLDELRAQQETIKTAMATIKTALDAKAKLEKAKMSEEISLTDAKKKHKSHLVVLDKDLKLREERERNYLNDLEEYGRQMEQLLKQIAEQVKKDKLPEAPKGYNFAARKGKLPWPVSGKVVNSFGLIVDKRTKTRIKSRGIEILTTHGEPVRSIGWGRVAMTNSIRGYGNFIIISHPNDYYTVYGHLSDIFVNDREIVNENTIIGSAGSTGLLDDSEAILKLEILNGSRPENPLAWLRSDRRRVSR